jgi:hypothetical protein
MGYSTDGVGLHLVVSLGRLAPVEQEVFGRIHKGGDSRTTMGVE